MTEHMLLRIARPDAPLAEKVVDAVREAISAGALVPGQRLTEREMIERTGVSRTSVREALRQLHTLGLVERAASGGLQVAVLDRAAIEHIYEVRDAIEAMAAELFVLKATDDEVAELVQSRKFDAEEAGNSPSPSPTYDEILLRGARNPILAEMIAPLHARIDVLRRLSLSMPGRSQAVHAEIEEIVVAVAARDAKSAAAASRRHIAAALQSALKAAGFTAGSGQGQVQT